MKQTLLTLTLALSSFVAMGQKQSQVVPDCNSSIFPSYPCKVAVIKDGKTIGYTEKNYSFYAAATLSSSFAAYTFKPINYKWIMFSPRYTKSWYIDNPDSSGGKYVMHLSRKNFKWLNDSTAVYSPDSLNKTHRQP